MTGKRNEYLLRYSNSQLRFFERNRDVIKRLVERALAMKPVDLVKTYHSFPKEGAEYYPLLDEWFANYCLAVYKTRLKRELLVLRKGMEILDNLAGEAHESNVHL